MSDRFAQLKQIALQRAVPMFAHLELTYACNWRCVFCYNPRHFDHRRLGLAEWEAVLDDLRALGTLTLTLTGGEPLASPDFLSIAEAARRRAFALRIFTNGGLVTEEMAGDIAALRPTGVEMSLHGASTAVHDEATGRPGSFEDMWRGIERLRRRDVALVLKTPLTRLNEHELDAMIALAAAHAIPYRIDPTLTPRDDGDRAPLAYSASARSLDALMTRLRERGQLPTTGERTAGGFNCGLGRLTVAIGPEGDVYPCLQWRTSSLGNVRVTPLRTLWTESPVRRQAAEVSRAANDKLAGETGALSRFPFCPALAVQHTGDPLGFDDAFVRHAEAADRARHDASNPPLS